jgi:hypothetical protein
MQKTDRELTDAAAQAAGIALKWPHDPSTYARVEGVPPRRTDTWETWDPLGNDGDALRLAVKLEMNIFQAAKSAYALPSDDDGTYEEQVRYADAGNDPCAATRRAIVRAAAALAVGAA